MKTSRRLIRYSIGMLMLMVLFLSIPVRAGALHQAPVPTDTPTPTSTSTPTDTPEPAPTATGTSTPTDIVLPSATASPSPESGGAVTRPVLVIKGYTTNPNSPKTGQDFSIKITLRNEGTAPARGVILSFESDIFLPRQTGGVLAVDNIYQNNGVGMTQAFNVSSAAMNGPNLLKATVHYTDNAGNAFSEAYTFTINVTGAWSGVAAATKTPVPGDKPQLVIVSYQTDSSHLSPGVQFALQVQVANMGRQDARNVTMAIGGATASSSQNSGDGENSNNSSVSMSGGDFTHFAPIGASNVQTLGTIPTGSNLDISQPLIVGINTAAGAYSLKISFVYLDKDGVTRIDDQVITLMVFTPPALDIGFYQPLDEFTVNQAGKIPLQVVNLGKKASILGRISLSSNSGLWEKNTATIGSVNAGDFYSLDAVFTPQQAGSQEIKIVIEYTDAFNNPQTVERILHVEVQDATQAWDDSTDGLSITEQQNLQPPTLWQRISQFFKGLFGLDSGVDSTVDAPAQ